MAPDAGEDKRHLRATVFARTPHTHLPHVEQIGTPRGVCYTIFHVSPCGTTPKKGVWSVGARVSRFSPDVSQKPQFSRCRRFTNALSFRRKKRRSVKKPIVFLTLRPLQSALPQVNKYHSYYCYQFSTCSISHQQTPTNPLQRIQPRIITNC